MYVRDGIAYASGELTPDVRITSANVVNDLCMLVHFTTGETRLFDAAPLLSLEAFAPLAAKEVFEDFTIDHGVLCWLEGEVDLSPSHVYRHSYRYEEAA